MLVLNSAIAAPTASEPAKSPAIACERAAINNSTAQNSLFLLLAITNREKGPTVFSGPFDLNIEKETTKDLKNGVLKEARLKVLAADGCNQLCN